MRKFFAILPLLLVATAASAQHQHGGAQPQSFTATPAFGPDGTLWLARGAKDRVVVARSSDLGKTFADAVPVTPGPINIDWGPDARPRVRPPVDVDGPRRDRHGVREGLAEIGGAGDHDAVLGPAGQPQRAIRTERRRGGEGLRLGAAMLVLRRGRRRHQQKRQDREKLTHQNLALSPTVAHSGMPSCGIDVVLTVGPWNDVVV